MNYHVYILYSETRDQFYTGFTKDLSTRLSKHNYGSTPSTRPGIPWKLIYSEAFESKREAILREREIKARKSRIYIKSLIHSSSVGWSVPIFNREGRPEPSGPSPH